MADEKPKSNIIRTPPPLPNEKKGDYDRVKNSDREKTPIIDISMPPELQELVKSLKQEHDQKKADRIERANPVMVTEFSEEAMTQLGLKKKDDDDDTAEPDRFDKGIDFITQMMKAAIPLMVSGGALFVALGEMFKGGPFQGAANLLAKGSVTAAFLALRMVGINVLRRLPIIGSIISLGSAMKRLSDGDVLGGLIDVGAAAAYMFPGKGTLIGIALDVLNARLDLEDEVGDGTGFFGALAKVKEWFSKNARNLPIVGGMMRLGEALGYFSLGGKDNILLGLRTLAGVFPGLVGLGGVYDWLYGSTELGNETTGIVNPESVGKFKDAVKNVTRSLYDSVSVIFDGILDSIIERLYSMDFIPKWALTRGLNALGLKKYVNRYAAQAEFDELGEKDLKLQSKIDREKSNLLTLQENATDSRIPIFGRTRDEQIERQRQIVQELEDDRQRIRNELFLLERERNRQIEGQNNSTNINNIQSNRTETYAPIFHGSGGVIKTRGDRRGNIQPRYAAAY